MDKKRDIVLAIIALLFVASVITLCITIDKEEKKIINKSEEVYYAII